MRNPSGFWALSLFFLLTPFPASAETPPAPSIESQRLYSEAIGLMNEGNMDSSLKKVDEMLAKEPDNLAGLNLRGAVLVRKKDYEAAEASFARILAIDSKNSVAHFNLAEVSFLRKDYAKAKGHFTHFMEVKGNEQNALGRYKIFLCDLLGSDPSPAMKLLETLEPTISNPLYYFAHAAAEFKQQRPEKGREFIQSAFGIYPGGMNAAFADSMVELGWIKQEEVASVGAIDASALNSLSTEFQPAKDAGPPTSLGFENVLPDFSTGGGKKDEKTKPKNP
jgi:tetratricopeptide (TPR) repeat protein